MIAPNLITNGELERVKALVKYNLDYTSLQSSFEDLIRIAQLATGMPIALLNLIDADNLWIAAAYGFGTGCLDKEKSVCQYTIQEKKDLEIKDLLSDARSKDLDAVKQLGLKYYYGVPIRTHSGFPIGTLCVANLESGYLSQDKKEILQLLANEVIKRLDDFKQLEINKSKVQLLEREKRILAHDIRGPLGGVIGLADLALNDGDENSKKELLQYLKLIKESSCSMLEMAEDILRVQLGSAVSVEYLTTLKQLKEKIAHLFAPRIQDKQIQFSISISKVAGDVPFGKDGVQQIIGNLVSNALKFTSSGGSITLSLQLTSTKKNQQLEIKVVDSGTGIDQVRLKTILSGGNATQEGTNGELGYGLGLQLVKQLVNERNGTFTIHSKIGEGSCFQVTLPVFDLNFIN
jgi:signal transduction histidine kinase